MLKARGAFARRIENSGRLTLPDVLREAYPDKSLYVTPGFDETLRIYSQAGWKAFAERLAQLDEAIPEHTDFLRLFGGLACEVELDGNDRLRIPEVLLKYMGIDEGSPRDVVLFDLGGYLEVWSAERWNRFVAERSPALKELSGRIFGKGQQGATSGRQGDGASAHPGDGS